MNRSFTDDDMGKIGCGVIIGFFGCAVLAAVAPFKTSPRPVPKVATVSRQSPAHRQRATVWDQPDECVRQRHGRRIGTPDTYQGISTWTCSDGDLLVVRWSESIP